MGNDESTGDETYAKHHRSHHDEEILNDKECH